ncbi:hypothetical protein [Corynebacterium sp. 335C]
MKFTGNALAVLLLGIVMTVAMWLSTHALVPTLIVLAITLIATVVFARLQSHYDEARAALEERPPYGVDDVDEGPDALGDGPR